MSDTMIDRKIAATRNLRLTVDRLHLLAFSFDMTGNKKIWEELVRLGDKVDASTDELDTIISSLLNQLVSQAQQASSNMLSLALALGESEAGPDYKGLLKGIVDTLIWPFDDEFGGCLFCGEDEHESTCPWQAAKTALEE